MMVESKKSSVSWRQEIEPSIEAEGRPPDRAMREPEHIGLITVDDPVEMLLDTYDFSALHDRIMMAVATKPTSAARKAKLS